MVFVVTYNMYANEGSFNVGVFSSAKKAKAYIASMRDPSRYEVDTWPLDDPAEDHTRLFAKRGAV